MGSNLTESSAFSANVVGPDPSNFVTAASVRVMGSALACRTKALQDGKITVASGVTLTCASGGSVLLDTGSALVSYGTVELGGTGADKTTIAEVEIDAAEVDDLVVVDTLVLGSTAEATLPIGSNVAFLGRTRGRPRVYMADVATVMIDTTQADEFVLHDNPAAGAPNVIRLRTSTAPVPREDERITLLVPDMFASSTGGIQYTIEREDGTTICDFHYRGAGWHASISADFVFDGGVWRLSKNSGRSRDDIDVQYGVFPGAGA